MYKWHEDNRWYTLELYVVIIDINAFAPLLNPSSYPGIEEIYVNCL